MQDQLHRLVVVSLDVVDVEVCNAAVTLCGRHLAMAQEVLNGRQIGIGVEKLRGHGMPKPMTRDAEMILSGAEDV